MKEEVRKFREEILKPSCAINDEINDILGDVTDVFTDEYEIEDFNNKQRAFMTVVELYGNVDLSEVLDDMNEVEPNEYGEISSHDLYEEFLSSLRWYIETKASTYDIWNAFNGGLA